MMPIGEQRWEIMERIGVYAAGELEGEAAREVERIIFERPEYRRLAESYAQDARHARHLGQRARRGARGRCQPTP